MDDQLTIITLHSPHTVDFAAARNELVRRSPTPWVFFLDSDETMSDQLRQEIETSIHTHTYVAFSVSRQDYFLGRILKFGETGHVRLIRLARKDAGEWKRPIHEVWEVKGAVGELQNPLIHHSHPSIASFLTKIDTYSALDAQYRYRMGDRSSIGHIVLFPMGKFVRNYVLLQGFRDGIPGLIMALMMSFHSYLTWTKLYLLWHKK